MRIDFHAHILPGCDHGSDGLQTSLQQLELAEQAGITTVIATPHFYPQKESLSEFLARRDATYGELKAAYQGGVEIRLGAEVNLCGGLDHMHGIEQTCIRGTNLILLEMPITYWSQSMEETLIRFQDDSDLVPVLAHVDRYDPTLIEHLLDYGLLAQLNAESLAHHFVKKQRIAWVDSGSVVALGSDIHGVRTGYADFLHAIKTLKGRADTIFSRTERLLAECAVEEK